MIYICIPAHNEERTVGVLLWKIRQVMEEFPRDYEILLVDDASTDATPEVLEPYTQILPLTVHYNREREGYAAAVERMVREAVRRSPYPRRDIIVTIQADFSEDPAQIPELIKRIEGGVDIVNSAARAQPNEVPRRVRWSKTALGLLLRRTEWPEEISDPISGFRAYRIITLKGLLEDRGQNPLVEEDGWAANVALLRATIPYARRVDEVPVDLSHTRRNRDSRFEPWETGRQVLRLVRSANKEARLGSKVRRRRRRGGRRRRGRGGRRQRGGRGQAKGKRQDGGQRRGRGRGGQRRGGRRRGRRGRGGQSSGGRGQAGGRTGRPRSGRKKSGPS